MFRVLRQADLSGAVYVGYGFVHGNTVARKFVVSDVSCGGILTSNTWILDVPILTNIDTILVAIDDQPVADGACQRSASDQRRGPVL
jgi:hypothetical protein